MATESIHVTALIPAGPQAVYDAWLSSEQHAKMTGGDARIDPQVGGSHSAWGDYISGKTLELVPGARIVQSWRTSDFPAESVDSTIAVTFEPDGEHTLVSIAHTDIPEGQAVQYASGWYEHYFSPMTTYFAADSAEPAKKPAAKAARKPAPKKKAAAKKKPAAKKKAKKPAAKRPAPKKKAAAKRPAPKKKAAAKRPAPKKKAAPKKTAAKKKPAAKKRAKKPARKPAA